MLRYVYPCKFSCGNNTCCAFTRNERIIPTNVMSMDTQAHGMLSHDYYHHMHHSRYGEQHFVKLLL